MHQKLTSF